MATKRTLPLAALQQTLAYLFDSRPHALASPLEHWLATSKPFARFAQTYQQKIRKKVRVVRSAEEAYNLYCELRTAYLLLQEPAFAVEYEPYGKQSGRSPDFAVTYRTHTLFHVEVTRLRLSQQEQPLDERGVNEGDAGPNDGPVNHIENSQKEGAARSRRSPGRRLAHVVCDKLGQLSPSTPNVLWIWVQSQGTDEMELEPVMLGLKRQAEQRDTSFLARYGFRNPADFIRHYQRLGLLLVQRLPAPDESPLLWSNNDARYPLPAKVTTILYSLVANDNSQAFMAGDTAAKEEATDE